MILSALTRYYYRLAAQEDRLTGESKVPSYGFSEEKIGWVLELDSKGNLINVIPNLTADKKPKPRLMSVPRPEKRTSGIKPNFLWDKTAYVLGVESNQDKATAKDQPIKFAEKTFEAFKQYHLDLLEDSNDEGLMAIRNFLQQWQPEHFAKSICPTEMLDANVVFKLVDTSGYIHQREAAQSLWGRLLVSEESEQGLCLISGEIAPIARLHPAIKGVYGGQSAGGSIISFNKESFTSFGKEQGSNAPVSEHAAFAYTTALNYLLRTEEHRLTIGDASTVFWAEADNTTQAEAAEGFFAALMTPPDDEQENQKIFEELQKISKGRPLAEISPELSENTRFYVLGACSKCSSHFGTFLAGYHLWATGKKPQRALARSRS
ncbi:type I-C CRISPR-associated protein Cas8c/Csd1 [Mannheimia haemolytica]